MNTFWPSDSVKLTAATRGSLFMHMLVFTGLVEEDAGGAPYFILPMLATVVYVAGPFVEAEACRRGSNHIGFDAALLLLIMDVARKVGGALPPSLESNADELVNELRRSVWRMTPLQLREEITGQIPLALHSKWGALDPWEAVARSLDGKLNIAPRAIRDAVVKQARPDSRRREIEFLFSPSDPGSEMAEPAADSFEEVLPSREPGPDVQAEQLEQLQRARILLLAREPEFQQALEALWQDEATQKEIAAKLSVTDRTIWNWLARFRRQLDT